MNPFEMVVLIVFIVAVARVLRARYASRSGGDYYRDHLGNEYVSGGAAPHLDGPERARLEAEVATLKDRIAVLERLATDNHSSAELDREIAKLRAGASDADRA